MRERATSPDEKRPADYREWLATELAERKLQNPAFSLRSFSRKLGVSPACLSLVLAGKRRLSARTATLIADRMQLSPADKEALVASATRPAKTAPDRDVEHPYRTLAHETFRVIADWHHYAILSLAEVPGSKASPAWMSERLGISEADAADAYRRLRELGIVKEHRGRYRQVAPPLATRDDLGEASIRSHVRQHLGLAVRALDESPAARQDFSSVTMAIAPDKMTIAKEEIRKFRRRLCRKLETGRREKVYALSVQLYPLEKEENACPSDRSAP